jgi:hypothetical protein
MSACQGNHYLHRRLAETLNGRLPQILESQCPVYFLPEVTIQSMCVCVCVCVCVWSKGLLTPLGY